MRLKEFIKIIEEKIPPQIAIKGDKVGLITPTNNINVEKVLLLMDYIATDQIPYDDYDLLILHHPPQLKPPIPTYVIHSNWDIIKGGACDALANKLKLKVIDTITEGLGRICETNIRLETFIEEIRRRLKAEEVRIVNFKRNLKIDKIAIVSGFGLNPKMIKKVHEKNVKVYLSGDLTQEGAILAKNLDLTLIDAGHHTTELPGLYKLGELLSQLGVEVRIMDTKTPWETIKWNP
ncbi:Nif3-like dinuclear metal center hexameric protein [Methanothermobacter tenebrarum]|uniref:Nif3-like dinuclear metal center hexameric protein n=1 Tax=Methanothermobacter tenebrarum TaxID=680118 RepID=A0A328PA01_9EURY|nr:Nif3-like dinuclear metal center hexameric protein [Methanothermobacter tenebrarum]MBC7101213.1 Nif3-like dinuclear metal center hexameric protein [Methanobacteriales archaeon]MBC7117471.1 Nif3-like dinuclear metal center hexameric protein [Methanobacteriaceae archaeon]NPV65156.1 Nif3-like dinuclear metal center hexameric protein [Methanobacteriaceae archaeon]RAO79528.1 Nif3-like dinuclear metal center hexameric protein [Methanothermobacter tenebrarum]